MIESGSRIRSRNKQKVWVVIIWRGRNREAINEDMTRGENVRST